MKLASSCSPIHAALCSDYSMRGPQQLHSAAFPLPGTHHVVAGGRVVLGVRAVTEGEGRAAPAPAVGRQAGGRRWRVGVAGLQCTRRQPRARAGQGLPGLLHVSAAVHLVVPGQLLQQRRCPRHPSCRSSFTRQCRRGGTNGCFIGNTVPTLTGSRRPWAYPYPLRPACPQLCPHPSCCTP